MFEKSSVHSHFQKTRSVKTGKNQPDKHIPCYAHIAGSMQTKSRFPQEDVGLLGIVACSKKCSDKYFHISAKEWAIVQECVEWLKDHSIWIKVYKANLERVI